MIEAAGETSVQSNGRSLDTRSPRGSAAPGSLPTGSGSVAAVAPRLWVAVLVTFVPFLWRAVDYALLGSLLPLVVFLTLGGLVAGGAATGGRWARRGIRLWCAAMITWGAARIGLMGMIVATGLDEAHLQSQMNAGFVLTSAAYLIAGVIIWRRTRADG